MEKTRIEALKQRRAKYEEQRFQNISEFRDAVNEKSLGIFRDMLATFVDAVQQSNYSTAHVTTFDGEDHLVYPLFSVDLSRYNAGYSSMPISILFNGSGEMSFMCEGLDSRYPSYYSYADPEKYPLDPNSEPTHFIVPTNAAEVNAHNENPATPYTFSHLDANIFMRWTSFLVSHIEYIQNTTTPVQWPDSRRFNDAQHPIYQALLAEHFPDGIYFKD